MRWLSAGVARVAGAFTRRRRDREFNQELDAHLEMHIEDHQRNGLSHAEARRAALAALGGVDATREQHRDRRGLPWLDTFLQDLRQGIRLLRRNPGFTVVVVVALTVGVGVNVLIFNVAYATLLEPLPGNDPSRLVRIYQSSQGNIPYADYLEFRDRNRTLSDVAAFQTDGMNLRAGSALDHVTAMIVSGNYFGTLGVQAAIGRAVAPADDRPGAPGAVLISDALWRSLFGADPAVLGRSVALDGNAFTVIGVAPAGFTGTQAPFVPDLWIAWNAPGVAPRPEETMARGGRSASVIGRLRPEATPAAAQADLSIIAADIARTYPGSFNARTVSVYPARKLGAGFDTPAMAFVGLLALVTGLVLLTTCVNLASLLLARWTARRQEIGIRLALGAGRARLIRQLLTESLVLSCMAGIAAVGVEFAGTKVLDRVWLLLPVAGIHLEVRTNWAVAGFGIALSLLTTVLFGLLPALQSSRASVVPALKEGRAQAGASKSRLRGALVIGQVATSAILLVLAAVLVRSVLNAGALDIGFSTEHVLAASIDAEAGASATGRSVDLYEQVLSRVEQTPGIAAAAMVEIVPLGLGGRRIPILKEGQAPPSDPRTLREVTTNNVSRGYFRTLSIPLLSGRDFMAGDRAGAPEVAIVNDTFARHYWPGESAVGRRFRLGTTGPWLEVVGVARDSSQASIGEHEPMFYRPLAQGIYRPGITIVAKANGEPLAVLPSIRAQIQSVDPNLALYNVSSLEAVTRVGLLPVRLAATLAGILGVVALLLVTLGIYGVTSFVVRQRTREVGIRLALGASSAMVIRLLARQGMVWTMAGIAIGLTGASAVTGLLGSFLYDVGPLDPVAFLSVASLLAGTTFVACYIPGRRASRIDPLAALRDE